MEKIDQLFRNKLEHHSITPSAQAWDKMEAQLSNNNKRVVAWRAAAAILVGGLMIVLLYWLTASPEISEPILVEVTTPEKEIQTPTAVEKNALAEVRKQQSVVNVVKEKNSTPLTAETKVEKIETVEQPLEVKTHLMNEANETTLATLSAAEKPMVIEFVLEEVPEKTVTAQAAPSEKETGIKKMWEAVKEIKNGDRTLDLRQATQELFASSNKKETTKNQ